jgi:hypothetical protein
MQTIAMHPEAGVVVLGMSNFGLKLGGADDDPGVDHPTPPAPDRKKSGGKAKAKKKPAPIAKKKKKKK